MRYQEILPSPQFAKYVKCFWSLEYGFSADGNEPEPVIPDGCIEMVFNLADRFRRYHSDGEVEVQPSSMIVGQMHQSILIGPSGNVRLFGIRFRPSGAYPFFRFDLIDLFNRIEPLDSVLGGSIREVEERLASVDSFAEQVAVAESMLAGLLAAKATIDPRLQAAVNALSDVAGRRRIGEVARDIGISERGLERAFKRHVGLSPKVFSRTIRFQSVLRTLESIMEPNILDTALSFGYYDQSHLITDFRQFCGTSPVAFLERSHLMTKLFRTAE